MGRTINLVPGAEPGLGEVAELAEGAPLLRVYTGNRIVGSNPTLSARNLKGLQVEQRPVTPFSFFLVPPVTSFPVHRPLRLARASQFRTIRRQKASEAAASRGSSAASASK